MAELPGYLLWLEWVAGSDWPEGDPDGMWGVAEDWHTAAAGLREILADIDAAKIASLAAYSDGVGSEETAKLFDELRSGDQSLAKLAEVFDSVADGAHSVGTEIEYAQLMMITSLALLAAEIAAVWLFPPTAPAATAAAIGFTRIGIRILAQRLMNKIIQWIAKFLGQKIATFIVRHLAIDTLIGTMQDYGIQQYQVAAGNRDNVNWEQIAVTAVSSAAGAGAASPFGDWLGNKLGHEMSPWLRGTITGGSAGLVGAGAGFGGSVATQFGFDWATDGWDAAVENAKNTDFDWRMLTAGVSNGALSGYNRSVADSFYRSRHPDLFPAPEIDDPRIGLRPPGFEPGQGPLGADPLSDGSLGGGRDGDGPPLDLGPEGDPAPGVGPASADPGSGESGPRAGIPGESDTPTRVSDEPAGLAGPRQDHVGAGEPLDAGTQQEAAGSPRDGGDAQHGGSKHEEAGPQQDGAGTTRDGESSESSEDGTQPRADQPEGGADGQSETRPARESHTDPDTSADRPDGAQNAESDTHARPDEAKESNTAAAQRDSQAGDTATRPVEGDTRAGDSTGRVDSHSEPTAGAPAAAPHTGATPGGGPQASSGSTTTHAATPAQGGDTRTAAPTGASEQRPQTGQPTDSRRLTLPQNESRAGIADRPAGAPPRGGALRAGLADSAATRLPVTDGSQAQTRPEQGAQHRDSDSARSRDTNAARPRDTDAVRPRDTDTGQPREATRPRGADTTPPRDTASGRPRESDFPRTESDAQVDALLAVPPPPPVDAGSHPNHRSGPRTDATRPDTDTPRADQTTRTHEDPPRVDPANRGECAPMALDQISRDTNSPVIRVPDPVGPVGMSRSEVEAAAGAPLRDYTARPGEPRHQPIADALLARGEVGASALVVDEYAGPAGEYGVGAHAYVFTVRAHPDGGRYVEVSDPSVGVIEGFPPSVPRELNRVSAVLYDSAGIPFRPETTGPRSLLDGHNVGDAEEPGTRPDPADADPAADTAPIRDEWSDLTPAEVGRELADRTGLETFGFDLPGIDPDAAREYARAVVDMRRAFPGVDLRRVGIGDLNGTVAGRAYSEIDPATGRLRTDRIVLSTRDMSDPANFRERLAANVERGNFGEFVLDRPIHSLFVHEYGHAIDATGQHDARYDPDGDLLQHYMSTDPAGTVDGYRDWVRQLGNYSFDGNGHLRPNEALAEAFREVYLRGPDASPPARLLNDLLLDAARNQTGDPSGWPVHPSPDAHAAPDRSPAETVRPTRDPVASDGSSTRRDGTDSDPARNDDSDVPADPPADGVQDHSGPPVDGWSQMDAAEIQHTLEQRHGLEVVGFDNPRVDVDALREFARAIDERLNRFPQIHLDSVRVEPMADGRFARAISHRSSTDGRPAYTESITLNERLATDPALLRRSIALNIEDGHFAPHYADRPVYNLIVHEVGHALDTSGSALTRFRVEADLLRYYTRTHDDPTPDGYHAWLEQLPGLCFDARGALNPIEALPEGFADVERNGENASPPSKVLNAALLDAVQRYGTPRPDLSDSPRTDRDDMALDPPGPPRTDDEGAAPDRPAPRTDGVALDPSTAPRTESDSTALDRPDAPRTDHDDMALDPPDEPRTDADFGGGGEEPPRRPPSPAPDEEPPRLPGERSEWFHRMQIDQADWEARMAAEHARWLRAEADRPLPEHPLPGDELRRFTARVRADNAEMDARLAADRAQWLRELAGQPTTAPRPEIDPTPAESTDTVRSDGPDEWFERMRLEQAEWEARMDAERAAWLRGLSDQDPDDFPARMRAELAEWEARIGAERVEWLRQTSGLPETTPPRTDGDDPTAVSDGPPLGADGGDPPTVPDRRPVAADDTTTAPNRPILDTTQPSETETGETTDDSGRNTPDRRATPTPESTPRSRVTPDPTTRPFAEPETPTVTDPALRGFTHPRPGELVPTGPRSVTDPGGGPPLDPDAPTDPDASTDPDAPTEGSTRPADPEAATRPDPMADIETFLTRHAENATPVVRTEAEQAHARRLAEALGLDRVLAEHPDPLGALRELAEMARARGFLGDFATGEPPRPMRHPDDFAPLEEVDRVYGDEPYWRSEASQRHLDDIAQYLRDTDQTETPTPRPRAADPDATRPAEPATTDPSPRLRSLDDVREELLRRFDLTETQVTDENLARTIADLRYRNLLRAGAVEALADAVARHDRATADEADTAAAVRDAWARRLGVDPADLTPEYLAALRRSVLREASDIADLADVVQTLRQPPAAGEERRYVVDVDGERVPVRLVADGDGGWRVEIPTRVDAPAVRSDSPARPAEPEPRKSLLRRLWEAVRSGYQGHTPKYPSGSGLDGQGQQEIIHLAGHISGSTVLSEFGGNPARMAKEAATMWKRRELIPFLHHLTGRVVDRAGEYDVPLDRDGNEYTYWLDEADPESVRRELGVDLADLRRDYAEQQRRRAEEPTEERREGPDPGADLDTPPTRELTRTDTEMAAMVRELSDALDVRAELGAALEEHARALGVDVADMSPEQVRHAVELLRYRLARRMGALVGLAEAAARYNAEDARIPYSDEVDFFDTDPMSRFLAEVVRANDGRGVLFDWQGVNNGGEPQREWGDLAYSDQPGRDQGVREYFENALRRDQIKDERAVWAQLLGVDLDALGPATLRDTVADQLARIRQQAADLADFTAETENFLRADSQVRELADVLSSLALHDWILSRGGAMLTPQIGLLAGEDGGPRRMIVIDGAGEHDRVVAEALAANARLADAVNAGTVRVEYRLAAVDVRGARVQGYATVHLVDGGSPEVRHLRTEVDGRPVEVTMLRDPDGPWRAVPTPESDGGTRIPESADTRTGRTDETGETRTPEDLRRARDAAARELGLDERALRSPEALAEAIARARHENALRAGRIEAIIDYARTAWDIDDYNSLTDARNALANRLGVDLPDLTPRRLAEIIADPKTRNSRRLQQVESLVKYAKLLRGLDGPTAPGAKRAVDAARDRLARRLGVDPADLFPMKHTKDLSRYQPDPNGLDAKKLRAIIARLVADPTRRAQVADALAEYVAALERVDPYAGGDRTRPIDPRVADVELPTHDRAVEHLLGVLDDVAELADALPDLGLLDDESTPPGPDRGASADWAAIVGVDLTNADAAQWAKIYEVYRDGKIDQHERLTPAQLAEVQARLRDQIRARADELAALADLADRYERALNPEPTPERESGPTPSDLPPAAGPTRPDLPPGSGSPRPDLPPASGPTRPDLPPAADPGSPGDPPDSDPPADGSPQRPAPPTRPSDDGGGAARLPETEEPAAPRRDDSTVEPTLGEESTRIDSTDESRATSTSEDRATSTDEDRATSPVPIVDGLAGDRAMTSSEPVEGGSGDRERSESVPRGPVVDGPAAERDAPADIPVDTTPTPVDSPAPEPRTDGGASNPPHDPPRTGLPAPEPEGWRPDGPPRPHTPVTDEFRDALPNLRQRIADAATARAEAAREIADRAGRIGLGVEGRTAQEISRALDDAMLAETARVDAMRARQDVRGPEMVRYFADLRAAEQRVADLSEATRHLRTHVGDYYRALAEENTARAEAGVLAARDVLAGEGARVVAEGVGVIPEDGRVVVASPLADPDPIMSADTRARLAEQGLRVEYRQVTVDENGVTVTTLLPPEAGGASAARTPTAPDSDSSGGVRPPVTDPAITSRPTAADPTTTPDRTATPDTPSSIDPTASSPDPRTSAIPDTPSPADPIASSPDPRASAAIDTESGSTRPDSSTERISPEARAEIDRLTAERDAALDRADEARAERTRRADRLPVDPDVDLTRENLAETLDRLRGRTMRVEEMPRRHAEIDALEHAAEDVLAAEDEVRALDERIDATRLAATPEGVYDELVRRRAALTSEREFWRAKRDTRFARFDTRSLPMRDPARALAHDHLTTTVEQLSATLVGIRDIAGLGDETGTQTRELVGEAEIRERLRRVFELQEAAERFNDADQALAEVDQRLAELAAAGVGPHRPPDPDTVAELERLIGERAEIAANRGKFADADAALTELDRRIEALRADLATHRAAPTAEIAAELDRIARERADRVLAVKPWRVMRDDLAARLRVDPTRLGPEDLADAIDEAAGRTVRADQVADRARQLASLREAAEHVNRVDNEIGRLQDRIAELGGATRDHLTEQGARQVTDRVGIVAGERPRIIVLAPRGELAHPRADHDAALADALRRDGGVAQAFMRPETTIEYRALVADRTGVVRVEDLAPPRREILETGWRDGRPGIQLVRWRDGEGTWHPVDPTRPDWQTHGDPTVTVPKKFSPRDLPEGVSGWAVEPFQASIVDPFIDHPPGAIDEALLPRIPGGQPVDPGVPTFEAPFAGAFYHTMRIILETAKLSGFTWFNDSADPGRIKPGFKGHPFFRARAAEVQPMAREWDVRDGVPDRGDLGEWFVRTQRAAEANWARVQEWADGEYRRFRADDSDIDTVLDTLAEHRAADRADQARDLVDRVARQLAERGDVDVPGLTDLLTGHLRDERPGDAEQLITDLRDILREQTGIVDRAELARPVADQLADTTPEFTRDEIEQIKNHLMRDEMLVRDPRDGVLVRRPLDAVADVAEAWNRLVAGNPLPEDILMLRDGLAESEYLRANPTATWRDANQHVIMNGLDWNAHRPPLTDWRAGIPYAPAPVTRDTGLPPRVLEPGAGELAAGEPSSGHTETTPDAGLERDALPEHASGDSVPELEGGADAPSARHRSSETTESISPEPESRTAADDSEGLESASSADPHRVPPVHAVPSADDAEGAGVPDGRVPRPEGGTGLPTDGPTTDAGDDSETTSSSESGGRPDRTADADATDTDATTRRRNPDSRADDESDGDESDGGVPSRDLSSAEGDRSRSYLPGSSLRSHIPHPPKHYDFEMPDSPDIEARDPQVWIPPNPPEDPPPPPTRPDPPRPPEPTTPGPGPRAPQTPPAMPQPPATPEPPRPPTIPDIPEPTEPATEPEPTEPEPPAQPACPDPTEPPCAPEPPQIPGQPDCPDVPGGSGVPGWPDVPGIPSVPAGPEQPGSGSGERPGGPGPTVPGFGTPVLPDDGDRAPDFFRGFDAPRAATPAATTPAQVTDGNGHGGVPAMPPMAAAPSRGAGSDRRSRRDGGTHRDERRDAATILVRSDSGELAEFYIDEGGLREIGFAVGLVQGVFGALGEVTTVFYRAPGGGLWLRVGDQVVDLEDRFVDVEWSLTGRACRFMVRVGDTVVCDLGYAATSAETDLGLLIRDVLTDPDRRTWIFTR